MRPPTPTTRPTLGALIDSGAAVGAGTGELLGLGDRPTAVRASDPDVVGRTMEAEAGR